MRVARAGRPLARARVRIAATLISASSRRAQVALTLGALRQLGLLQRQEGIRNPWGATRKALNLVVDDMPEVPLGEEPPDLA